MLHSKKIRYLLLSETLSGFPSYSKTFLERFRAFGNLERVSDINKYRIFLECRQCYKNFGNFRLRISYGMSDYVFLAADRLRI